MRWVESLTGEHEVEITEGVIDGTGNREIGGWGCGCLQLISMPVPEV
jgi:hypothetical protein